jgi:HSP20 family protein
MALTPWEQDMMPLREAVNRLIEDSFIGSGRLLEPFVRVFPVDVRETDDTYVVEASLPGVKADEIEVTAEDDRLTIRATRKREEDTKKAGTFIRHERYEGEIRRTISLPTAIDVNKVSATYEHGVLTLQIPRGETTKAKQIKVQVKESGAIQ